MNCSNKLLSLLALSATICGSMRAMDADGRGKEKPPASALVKLAQDTATGALLGMAEPVTGAPCFYFTNVMQPKAGEPAKSWMQRFRAVSPYPRTWYAGFGTMVGGMAPITALQNGCAEGFGRLVTNYTHEPMTNGQKLATAGTAGAVSAVVSCPQELLVLYQQNAERERQVKLSTMQAFNEVKSKYGVKALYRGFWPVARRDGMFTAGYKALTPMFDEFYKDYLSNDKARKLAAAVSAGVLVTGLTHPDTRIKKCMHDDLGRQYPTAWQTMRTLVKNQGWKSLFDGVEFRNLRVVLALAGMSTAEDKVKEWLKK